jgi:hypothetical protein
MLRIRTLYVAGSGYSEAQVGDILCSDLSIVTAANYAASGKTAIGIAYYNNNGDIRFMHPNPILQAGKAFGPDVNITDLADITTESGAIADTDGSGNTDKIINQQGAGTTYSPGYCRAFSTAGTSVGDWYMPALGELSLIIDNVTAINAAITAILGASYNIGNSVYIQSSTEYGYNSGLSLNCYWYALYYNSVKYIGADASKTTVDPAIYIVPCLKINY